MERNPASALQVDVSRDGVVAMVTVTGELDITTAPSLTRRLLEVGAAHPDRLVLDLSGLVLVDVAGARALDEAHTLLQAECPVILRTPRPSARKFLGLAGRMEGLEQSPPRSVACPTSSITERSDPRFDAALLLPNRIGPRHPSP